METTKTNVATESSSTAPPDVGRQRVVIESVEPEVDGGRFPIKRIVGDRVEVNAAIFTDGHDELSGVVRFREENTATWREAPLHSLGNDRWQGEFVVGELGRYEYTLLAWVDHFKSWRSQLAKKSGAGQDVTLDLQIGANLIADAARRATGSDASMLHGFAARLRDRGAERAEKKIRLALADELVVAMERHPDRSLATTYPKVLAVVVDRERARHGAWYELFPRSSASAPGRHGTLRDVEKRLPDVAEMGFDVLYLPPIHPIGRTERKGKNNSTPAESGAPGSPWAIGAAEGGHDAIHPELGTIENFRKLVARARELGVEIACDLAFQCSPDHPWVREHPAWFRWRPDGTVQYAENPPKKYQDIYPLNFESEDWRALWAELKRVTLFWVEQGVRIFRVDNPHTKPFAFWEWLIREVKRGHPEVIFLAEAFARPRVMYELAKLGFDQSYTYFAWRNTKDELTRYFTELTRGHVREFYRPNLWPNTPDILTEYLQFGGRPAFIVRLVLAATLGATYGIYGPAFELCEVRPVRPGSEEYLDSEKYEIKHWNIERPDSLRGLMSRVNRIRRENPALQRDAGLEFHAVDNDEVICYSKSSDDGTNVVVVVVNLDPHHVQAGRVELPAELLALAPGQTYQAHDLLGDARYLWHGRRNMVQLDPRISPAQVFQIQRRVHTERDFEYFQ